MAKKYDVIIIGGGMVGLGLASLLHDHFSIAIIDPQPFSTLEQLPSATDSRVSALSRKSEQLLELSGAWQKLSEVKSPYQSMRVWDANTSSRLTFDAQEIAEPNLGHIVENQRIRSAFYETLVEQSNIDFIDDPFENIERDESRVICYLKSGDKIESPLLVGADGARSKVREVFEFDVVETPYHQVGLVANIQTEHRHELTAWQRFLSTGPIAYLPLKDPTQCSIVWSATDELATTILSLKKSEQEQRIAAAMDSQLGAIELITDLKSFPLVARHAKEYTQERVVLIGDAAHSIHPLAGQGVNLGFLDAMALAERLIDKKKKDIGLRRNLRRYERERKGHNHLVQQSMTALNWFYGKTDPLSVLLRSFGVNAVNELKPVKDLFIKQAMGL